MYLLPNPTKLTIAVRPDPQVPGDLIFADTEFYVRCEPGRRREPGLNAKLDPSVPLKFELLEATRTPDCLNVFRDVWRIEDAGTFGNGNGRIVRIHFEGLKLSAALANARKEDNVRREDPRLVLRETILHHGDIGLLIGIAGRTDGNRVDNLLIDLRYVVDGPQRSVQTTSARKP